MKNVQTVVYLIYYVPAVLRRSEDLHFSGKVGSPLRRRCRLQWSQLLCVLLTTRTTLKKSKILVWGPQGLLIGLKGPKSPQISLKMGNNRLYLVITTKI
jgi:hypothetical protein